MTNANKSPKIPYSAMVRKVEKASGICIRDRITNNQNIKFQRNRLITFAVILHTVTYTDRQTDRPDHNNPALAEIKNSRFHLMCFLRGQ